MAEDTRAPCLHTRLGNIADSLGLAGPPEPFRPTGLPCSAVAFDALRASALQWLPEIGIGWYPVRGRPYDREYWDRYRCLDSTAVGASLTTMRVDLVARYWTGPVVDIGVGGGRFVVERPNTTGFDVNPVAADWLVKRGAWVNPYREQVEAACFWDSLEHIYDPEPLLNNVRRWAFLSLPIFDDAAHVLRSKHFRRDEHCWYFTATGFRRFMDLYGFEQVYADTREQAAGREDIMTFVFERR